LYGLDEAARVQRSEVDVATRTERIEARVAPRDRARIDKAAALEGQSVSAFMVSAAAERAAQVIAAATTTISPAEYFDRLASVIDRADRAPRLTRAVKLTRKERRIA
jgi:uncharacterized protein (DUF1778 family)